MDPVAMQIVYEPRDPTDFPAWHFSALDFEYHPATRSAWMSFKADGPPCFTFQTLTDMANVRESLRVLNASDRNQHFPVHYVALASNKPGVFSLGGDLAMFSRAIRQGEHAMLRAYAHACIDVVHGMFSAYGLPVITVGVLSGQALGGGLESALAQDVLFADEAATLGVPEVAFNTFPGMGAVTLLTRRIGAARAERVITGGEAHTAHEMLALGIVDRVASVGTAKAAALDWMVEGGDERRVRRLAITQARRTCFPVTWEELINIVDVWTDCSCDVTPQDLRHMDRLVAAQTKMRRVG